MMMDSSNIIIPLSVSPLGCSEECVPVGSGDMADSKKAILFDLDETLVLTQALEPLRKARNWPAVYAGFSQTQLPPKTLEFISGLKATGKFELGVVTKARDPMRKSS